MPLNFNNNPTNGVTNLANRTLRPFEYVKIQKALFKSRTDYPNPFVRAFTTKDIKSSLQFVLVIDLVIYSGDFDKGTSQLFRVIN